MGKYWSNLIKSFAPGGTTPLQALFDLSEDEGLMDYVDKTTSGQYSWTEYPEALEQPSDLTPSDTSFSDITYADEFLEKYQEAVDNQNAAAQSSADRAMEFEAEQAQLNRDFQAAQAQKAMDYQTEMSNTAYQRAMDDLRKAGLNPKLVAQLGGASTPSGVAGSGSQASGHSANMSMANVSALSGVLQSYITSSASMDNKDKDFVQETFGDLLYLISAFRLARGTTTGKIGF